jgi:D-alanyl-D-alanine endopeptidase (penicillin-binding protein 7)
MKRILLPLGMFAVLSSLVLMPAHAVVPKRASASESQTPKRAVAKTKVTRKKAVVKAAVVPKTPSYGQQAGLHGGHDALALKSSVAFVVDQETNEVLFRKNELAVLPIASITKLMTGLLISEAKLPMDEMITISQDDVDLEKGSSSRCGLARS